MNKCCPKCEVSEVAGLPWACNNFRCPCHSDIEKPSTVEVGHAQGNDSLIEETARKITITIGIPGQFTEERTKFLVETLSDFYTKARASGREEADWLGETLQDARESGKKTGRAEFAREFLEKIGAMKVRYEGRSDLKPGAIEVVEYVAQCAKDTFRTLIESELNGLNDRKL